MSDVIEVGQLREGHGGERVEVMVLLDSGRFVVVAPGGHLLAPKTDAEIATTWPRVLQKSDEDELRFRAAEQFVEHVLPRVWLDGYDPAELARNAERAQAAEQMFRARRARHQRVERARKRRVGTIVGWSLVILAMAAAVGAVAAQAWGPS